MLELKADILQLRSIPENVIAFVGDGINDATALVNIGIVMRKLGNDAEIEIADIGIQTDRPSKIAQLLEKGSWRTHRWFVSK